MNLIRSMFREKIVQQEYQDVLNNLEEVVITKKADHLSYFNQAGFNILKSECSGAGLLSDYIKRLSFMVENCQKLENDSLKENAILDQKIFQVYEEQ